MMSVFGKRVDVPCGRRRAAREPVLLGATTITIENSQSVIVEDVCRNGAKLRSRNPPAVGAQMLLRAGGMRILATVAWLVQDGCGITFEMPLDGEGVQRLKKEGQWAMIMGIDPVPRSGGPDATLARYPFVS